MGSDNRLMRTERIEGLGGNVISDTKPVETSVTCHKLGAVMGGLRYDSEYEEITKEDSRDTFHE